MNCYIKQIIIFNSKGEKRFVSLEQGLNIITGDSKTGKSALIEIVDYCFCSKFSGIPKGEITNFGYLYAIILAFPTKYVVIGRKAYLEGGNTKMYVKVETNDNIINNLTLDYFTNQSPSQYKDVQVEIEHHFGMAVTNMAVSDAVEATEKRKASLRDMTSFFFQHQNLMANKHALFYRFDDTNTRSATIDSFLIFAGVLNDEYFSLKRKEEDLKKQLRNMELSKEKKDRITKYIEKELKEYFIGYFKLVGEPFNNNLTFQELINLRDKLPNYSTKTFANQDALNRYNLLKKEQEEKNSVANKISKQIKDLEETERYANNFQVSLKILKAKPLYPNDTKKEYLCPTCGKKHELITEELHKILVSKDKIANELNQLSTYAVSYQKEIGLLNIERAQLKKDIILLDTQIHEIEKNNAAIEKEKNVSNQVIYAKASIDVRIDTYLREKKIIIEDNSISELKSQLQIVKQKLTKYDTKTFYERANTFISQNMNKIANKLDFEEQLKPIDFRFKADTLSLFYNHKDGEMKVSEMGSGANWLTCHISLFLSLHHYFVSQDNSVIPNILFFDQPSQVYFPSEFGKSTTKDNDISQVEKIYIAILDELEVIKQEVGFLPQVIVTDHADNLDLGKFEFESYIRGHWHGGIALI